MTPRVVVIDNYDSFTFNLVHYFQHAGAQVQVYRNDAISLSQLQQEPFSHLCISPGPCTPNESGVSLDAIAYFADKRPLLGVCLGHQAIAQVFGGHIVRAPSVMHGKTSAIHHTGTDLFRHIPSPFRATRYHSLIVDRASIPDCLQITAWTATDDPTPNLIMGLQHRDYPVFGVQFHPEAILSEHGHQLLENFLSASA